MPLRMAEGTSLALPTPNPTTLAEESPTTTSAEKLRFLPPLTTLVTRLIDTTCSFKLSDCGSIRFTTIFAIQLKLQSCFAGGIGQRLDAPMVNVSAAIEHHLLDPFFLGTGGDGLADEFGAGHVSAGSFGGNGRLLGGFLGSFFRRFFSTLLLALFGLLAFRALFRFFGFIVLFRFEWRRIGRR